VPSASRRSFLLLIGLVSASASLAAGKQRSPDTEKWIGLSTPHFQLYTTNDLPSATAALQRFEVIHSFFEQAALFKGVPQSPVQIIAFSSDREYQAYTVNPGAFAYYQRTRRGDYIVMRDLAPEHYEVSMHEYTHFIFQHSGLTLPLWVNEGLADLYSSVEARHGQVLLGKPPFGRLYTLQNKPWLELETLLAVAHGSPYYSQPDKMQAFYAESWGLTHMLALNPEYSPQFPKFLSLLSRGTSPRECFQLIYHKTLNQIVADLQDHVSQKQLPGLILDIDLNAASRIEPQSLASPQAQAELALADLAASNLHAQPQGESQLRSLSNKYPDSPEAEESLGYLALTQNRLADAQSHFAKAVERHSTSPEVLFYLAHLQRQSGAPNQQVIDLLNRALALDPASYNARLELGCVAAKADRFELAVAMLSSIETVKPEHAYVLNYTLAYSYAQLAQHDPAQTYGVKARGLAAGGADQEQADNLLRYIDRVQQRTAIAAAR
jgi:Flp pilus assembly protein TadD